MMNTIRKHFRNCRVITSMLLTALFLSTSFLFAQDPISQTQLRITTTPADAMAHINGEPKSTTPLTVTDIKPGKHLLKITKSGYKDLRKSIKVNDGQLLALDFNLELVTGLLLVDSDPRGIEIQIDGADRGKTPKLITDLPIGSYRMKLNTPGYLAKEIDLKIKNRTPVKIDVKMTSDSASLGIDSVPQGARITLNGLLRGTTPATLDRIPGGKNKLELTLAGYQPYEREISLSAGQKETVKASLEAIPSKLKIVSIPAGARIYVDNQFKGESPIQMEDLKPGSYRIRAELSAFTPAARTIELGLNEDITEEFRMARNSGSLLITTEPADVTVLIDDKVKGVTKAKIEETDRLSSPLRIEDITIGNHVVKLTRKGYHDLKFPLAIEKDKTATTHKKLNRRFIPNYEVRTMKRVYKGVFIEIDPKGNVKIETQPGIFKTIPGIEIRSRRPIKTLIE